MLLPTAASTKRVSIVGFHHGKSFMGLWTHSGWYEVIT